MGYRHEKNSHRGDKSTLFLGIWHNTAMSIRLGLITIVLIGCFLTVVAWGGDSVVLHADISIIEQGHQAKNEDKNEDKVLEQKKIRINWESLGLASMRDSLKKFKPKSLLSAISLKYLYRHLMQLALAEHDRFVGNPYELEEATAVKLAHAQTQLMQSYVRLLSDPEVMGQLMNAQNGGSVSHVSSIQRMATTDMANLLSPEQAVDFFVEELTQQSFFPKDPAEYDKFKRLALKWGAIPIGVIVLGNKLDRENLGGQIHLPVFMLPSGYLGLAFTARVDHIGLSLSPRLVGQGELVLMRFRVKGTVEEKRGKLFSDESRNFEAELSEDWSNLFLKRYGLTSHFYYKNRLQMNIKEGTEENIHELGWNLSASTPGYLLGVIPYSNFSAKMSVDSRKNVQGGLLINQITPNYVWSVVMNGAFNFSTQEGNLTGQAQLTKPLSNSAGLTAGLSVQGGTAGVGGGGFIGITDEARNLSGRVQFSVQENRGSATKWQVGLGVAGQLENQKRLDEKYLRHLDGQLQSNTELFERYESGLHQNIESLVQTRSPLESVENFEKEYQSLIVPLAFSLEQVGFSVERALKEYQTLVVDFERKYRAKAQTAESQAPEQLEKINGVIGRYRELKAKGPANLKSSILFLALAEHLMAD